MKCNNQTSANGRSIAATGNRKIEGEVPRPCYKIASSVKFCMREVISNRANNGEL